MIVALRCSLQEHTRLEARFSLSVLAHDKRRRHTGDGDAEVRWSPPGVARQSVLPTPATVRTDRTGRTRGGRSPLRVFSQGKHLDELPAPIADPVGTKA